MKVEAKRELSKLLDKMCSFLKRLDILFEILYNYDNLKDKRIYMFEYGLQANKYVRG